MPWHFISVLYICQPIFIEGGGPLIYKPGERWSLSQSRKIQEQLPAYLWCYHTSLSKQHGFNVACLLLWHFVLIDAAAGWFASCSVFQLYVTLASSETWIYQFGDSSWYENSVFILRCLAIDADPWHSLQILLIAATSKLVAFQTKTYCAETAQ